MAKRRWEKSEGSCMANCFCRKNNVNFSKFLQDALLSMAQGNKEVKRSEKEKRINEGIAAQFHAGADVPAPLLLCRRKVKRIEEQRNAPQLSPWGIPFPCLGSCDPKRICSVSSRFPSYA